MKKFLYVVVDHGPRGFRWFHTYVVAKDEFEAYELGMGHAERSRWPVKGYDWAPYVVEVRDEQVLA